MIRTHQASAPARGRSLLALSVLALLAFVCLSGPAQAESSSGLQYQDAPPTVTGGTVPNDRDPSAGSSKSASGSGGNSSGSASSGDGTPAANSSPGSGDAAKTAKDGGTGQQGSQGKSSGGAASPGKTLGSESKPASSQDDGSSPLIPILIAIAVLAAISIGAVVYRRRRAAASPDSGAPVSPEAG